MLHYHPVSSCIKITIWTTTPADHDLLLHSVAGILIGGAALLLHHLLVSVVIIILLKIPVIMSTTC